MKRGVGMSGTLAEFAAAERATKSATPFSKWMDAHPDLLAECREGLKTGAITLRTISRYLQKDHGCPFSDTTIRRTLGDL